ncbi:MAG: glycosyltransferase family 4 protein [Pacificimonas sp.]
MRIAQLAPMVFPVPPVTHGGTERVVHDLTEALVAAGQDVTLFAATDSRTSAKLLGVRESLAATIGDDDEPAGLLEALEAANLEALRSRLDEFDIIHAHVATAHAEMLGDARAPSLTTIHWRADQDDRRAMFADHPHLPVNSISQDQGRAIPATNHVGTVHHGIPFDRFQLGPGGGPAAFIGRMTDQKQPDAAIRIADAAGVRLTLAGTVDRGNPTYFAEQVEPLLGAGASFFGAVDERQKQTLLGDARALIFPIDWPEPFGLVMIEAMACGTPVVAFRRGSVPEIVEDGVTGFVVDTEDEAVSALRAAATLDRARIRQRFEASFTSDRMARDYLRLYRQLAA